MQKRVLLMLLAVLTVTLPLFSCSSPGIGEWTPLPAQTKGDGMLQWSEPPAMMIDTNKEYRAIMETEYGKMVLELYAKDVPITVNNFVFLATQGYYDNTTFHRVIADFMVQGGDPTGTGSGGPGYTFANEITSYKHIAGALSMANTGQPNSNGSQFFITLVATPWLDGQHTVFGCLVEGADVLKKIRLRDPSTNPTYEGDKLLSVKIEVRG